MVPPDQFERRAGYSCFHAPPAPATLAEAIDLVSAAIVCARENGIARLVVDIRALTGIEVPGAVDRYRLAERFAADAAGALQVALVVPAELIDPNRFGSEVARLRGLRAAGFPTEEEAVDWLLGTAG